MTFDRSGKLTITKGVKKSYPIRRILSQVLATTIKTMLTFEFGCCISFTGIVGPALTGFPNEHNKNETLTLDGSQSSWLGSILFICQPIGSVISALITDYLGRRRAMMVVNIPYAIAWFMMYRASHISHLFIANALLGFSIGLMEAPIMTYVGEICEPSVRGILIAYTNLGTSSGQTFVYFLNTLMAWRLVGLYIMFVPIVTLIALYFVPETPHWLLSKGYTKRAENALCWVRGWVPKEAVSKEFERLQNFSMRAKSCKNCTQENKTCTHPPPNLIEKFSEFKRKRTLKSFFIVISLFVIVQFSGTFAMTPYWVRIFKAYQSPIEPDVATAILSFLNIFATITFMCLVRFMGKRRLYLTVLSGVCISSLIVSCYGFIFLPRGYNSFDKNQEMPQMEGSALVYIPTVFLIFWSFCSYCGILMMPWQMLSEIFAFKTRGVAAGLAAAINYTMGFASVKTYYNLETFLSLPGVAIFYFCCATTGLILMFNVMPETENRTLEDIELHFSDNSKKITDWKIPMASKLPINEHELKSYS